MKHININLVSLWCSVAEHAVWTVSLFPASDTLQFYITTHTTCFAFSALFWAPTG